MALSAHKTQVDWSPELRVFEGHAEGVEAIAFSPDGQLLASGSRDHTIRLWDAKTGVVLRVLEGHTASVTTIAFSLARWPTSYLMIWRPDN